MKRSWTIPNPNGSFSGRKSGEMMDFHCHVWLPYISAAETPFFAGLTNPIDLGRYKFGDDCHIINHHLLWDRCEVSWWSYIPPYPHKIQCTIHFCLANPAHLPRFLAIARTSSHPQDEKSFNGTCTLLLSTTVTCRNRLLISPTFFGWRMSTGSSLHGFSWTKKLYNHQPVKSMWTPGSFGISMYWSHQTDLQAARETSLIKRICNNHSNCSPK
jgi:hypothetical protein